jgi:uncharacterized repeat protein (TIGR03843 family)
MTVRELLETGEVELLGRMPWSSNHTFLVQVRAGEACARAVYKPERGERPLWDFPSGLHRREVAAAVLSDALGWGVVPETVVRDGPLGEGSVQRFVDADFEQHYFTIYEAGTHLDDLRAICALDVVANNTDRKSGHCLLGLDGRVYAIDNSLCFHDQPKLRTVIWEFGGEPVPEHLLADVARVAASPPAGLRSLLDRDEVDAVQERAAALVRAGVFPEARAGYRHYPWPLV